MITSPLQISNCQVWLDASDASTLYTEISGIRQNLILPFNAFENWAGFSTTVSPNVVLNPAGSISDADRITTTNTINSYVFMPSVTVAASTAYTFSVFVKPGSLSAVTLDYFQVQGFPTPGSGDGSSCTYDLVAGTVGTITNYGGTTGSTATITPSSDGWYLCALTVRGTATSYIPHIRLPTGVIGGNLFVYGATLELSSTYAGFTNTNVSVVPTSAVTTNLSPVGYFGDKSGNQRHFTSFGGSATTKPTWVSSLSTIRFDGTDDFLSSIFSVNFNNQTVFLVGSVRSYASQGRIYAQVNVAGTQDTLSYNFIPLVQTTSANTIGTNIDSATTRSSINLRSLNSYDIFSHVRSGGVLQNFINGVAGTSYTSVNTNYTSYASRLGMGFATGFGSTFVPSRVDISEVIVYDKALSNAERADVEYYLTRKWNFLNSIPRQTYAIKNGLWSDSATWSVSAEPSPWNFPLSADNAYTNTFTVTADSSTKVDTIRNSALVPNILSGGSFVLANGVSLSADLTSAVAPHVLSISPSVTAVLVGNLIPTTTNAPLVSCSSGSNLTVFGGCNSNAGGPCIINQSGGRLTIFGGVQGTSQTSVQNFGGICTINGTVSGSRTSGAGVVVNTGTLNVSGDVICTLIGFRSAVITNNSGTVNIVGNVRLTAAAAATLAGTSQSGVICQDYGQTTTVNITGNLGSYAIGSYNLQGGVFNIRPLGNLIPESNAACISLDVMLGGSPQINILNSTATPLNIIATNNIPAILASTTGTVSATNCNIINAPNGRQAIYAPKLLMFPGASATYTRHAVNGYDSYVDYWTSDATFTYPASSDVV